MSRKTKITINITAIIIIVLSLMGITFGYYNTKVKGNTTSKSIEVVTGNSSVLYTDLSETNTELIIEPDTTVTKIFTVKNTGNTKATYSIYLVDVVNEFTRTQDLTYTLYKKVGNNTINTSDYSDCEVLVSNVEYPKTVSAIKTDEVIETPEDTYTYAFVITYINHPTENQDIDQGKTFGGKINIRATSTDTNPYSEGTLAYNIYANGAQVLNASTNELDIDKTYTEKTSITKVSDGTDMSDTGIFTAPDDYGTSYYFRGPVKNNYVDFAGFTWRIVRINGDGSIRLILDGTLDKVNIPGTETKVHSSGTAFNLSYDKNAYVGYMYGTPGSDTYKGEHEFTGDKTTYTPGTETSGHSTIKVALDKFYDDYLKTYNSYIADTLFCGDKTLADEDGTDDNIGNIETQLGTGTNETYYAAIERLWFSSGETSITTATPTLMCANNTNDDYSRYSVNVQTLNSEKTTNGDLTYSIALLSADELVMAGAFYYKANTNYYLHNEDTVGSGWWTMTPSSFNYSGPIELTSGLAPSYSLSNYMVHCVDYDGFGVYIPLGVRPVINLRSDVLVDSGDGTEGAGVYKVRLP